MAPLLCTSTPSQDLVSSQLQAAQESALAYAVQEEENWLKELAREQSLQVDVQADAMDDSISDLGVSGGVLAAGRLWVFERLD